jgi:cytoskeletal protein RodZ
MHQTFGARLRAHRQERQIELSVIAEQSKIRVSLLEGLERDDVSQWPGGIFRRSYVRTYAQAIGLDPDAVVREFVALYPEPVDDDVTSVLAAARGISHSSRPRTRIELLLGSAIQAIPARRPAPAPEVSVSVSAATVNNIEVAPAPPPPVQATDEAAREPTEEPRFDAPAPPVVDPALERVAEVCTRIASASHIEDVADALCEAAGALDAAGLILWVWDPDENALAAGIAYGYSQRVLNELPRVRPGEDNPVAAAFRGADTHIVDGGDSTGAVVVPLINSYGCVGVLALELRAGAERNPLVRVIATVISAQLALLVWPVSRLHAATA